MPAEYWHRLLLWVINCNNIAGFTVYKRYLLPLFFRLLDTKLLPSPKCELRIYLQGGTLYIEWKLSPVTLPSLVWIYEKSLSISITKTCTMFPFTLKTTTTMSSSIVDPPQLFVHTNFSTSLEFFQVSNPPATLFLICQLLMWSTLPSSHRSELICDSLFKVVFTNPQNMLLSPKVCTAPKLQLSFS